MKLFEEQVALRSDAVAVSFGEQQLSYGELNGRANQLANYLRRLGVVPGARVAISLPRSIEMITAVLGVLKAGCCYVPIDQSYPRERLAHMLDDVRPSVVLTEQRSISVFSDSQAKVVCIDTDSKAMSAESNEAPRIATMPGEPAYIVFTSGSTGRPKGIIITHTAVMRLVRNTNYVQFDPSDRIAQVSNFSFDAFTFEIWGALLQGGLLEILTTGTVLSPADFSSQIRRRNITTMFLTTSLFNHLARETPWAFCSMRNLLVGGEAVVPRWVAAVLQNDPPERLLNGYGPTESTTFAVWYSIQEVPPAVTTIPIGRPLSNTQAYVLGKTLRLIPVGALGELLLAGPGLALGYLNDPELTAEKFVPHPFSANPGDRLYRTGDLARYLPDGNIDCVGRIDHQVKLRGLRIELTEVEAVLRQHPLVEDVVVVLHQAEGEEKRMVAYLTSKAQAAPSVGELRKHVKQRLPEFMVPAVYITLPEIPLTANGKVDRRALPAPGHERPTLDDSYVEPKTPTERALAKAWREVLKLDRVGIHDNFFQLGGDSIRSIQVLARAQDDGVNFTVEDLFQYQSIAELSRFVDQANRAVARKPEATSFSLIKETDRARLPPNIEDAYPLTRMQAGMVFHSEYDPRMYAVYHYVFNYQLRMRWDEAAMSTAIREMVQRNAVLRTSFDLTGYSEPLQLVHRDVGLPLEIADFRSLNPAEREQALQRALEEQKRKHFDWKQAPLIRICVYRLDEENLRLTLIFHHAIMDGWSEAVLMTELFQHYWYLLGETSEPPPPPPVLTYGHYVALEQQALASEETRSYWERHLRGSSPLHLPRMVPADARPVSEKRQTVTSIPPELVDDLNALAKSLSLPFKSVLLAAHLRILSWLGAQADVLTGMVCHGRPESNDGERIVGLFLNTSPFRMVLNGGSWIDLIRATFAVEREMLSHRLYPLAEIQRQRGGQPLFDVAFNFTNFHVLEGLNKFEGRMELLEDKGAGETNFTLMVDFNVYHPEAQVRLILASDSTQLSAPQIAALEQYYLRTLAAMAAGPENNYESLALLSEAECQQLLVEWNDTASGSRSEHSIADLFERQAALTPDAIALVCDGVALSYGELEKRANQLANFLRAQGIRDEALVGVCMERSLDMFIALLGTVKAEGVYVALDHSYPEQRLAFMLDDAQLSVLLTQQSLLKNLPATAAPLQVICLDSEWEEIGRRNTSAPAREMDQAARALYVIYTSGSTGQPKGVVGLERAALNRFAWMWDKYPFADDEVCYQKTSLGFVDAVWEVFGGLLRGVPTVIEDELTLRDARQLLNSLKRHAVSRIVLVPSLLKAMLAEAGRGAISGLNVRLCISSGEALTDTVVEEFRQRWPNWRLLNLYGSSEVAADVSCSDVSATDAKADTTIGRPISGTQLYVLDRRQRPVALGVEAELCAGGDCLARGYLRRPELTAEKFVPDPYATRAGARMYRTGDMARHLTGGTIEYRGRVDHQVKIRGYRIELGEVEAQVKSHAAVAEAVVMVREEKEEDQRLVCYLVPKGPERVKSEELRGYLRGKLPAYMVPGEFIEIQSIPLTASGKADRQALATVRKQAEEVSSVKKIKPRNETEEMVSLIWEEALGIKDIGVTENFFDLGGHSLLAMQVVDRLRDTTQIDLPVRSLFDSPTIAELAQLLSTLASEQDHEKLLDALKLVESLSDDEAAEILTNRAVGSD
ncbi:MAG TPA: amino acid adenylation domain-containing protein [Pyrinomonadaceae bacterium]